MYSYLRDEKPDQRWRFVFGDRTGAKKTNAGGGPDDGKPVKTKTRRTRRPGGKTLGGRSAGDGNGGTRRGNRYVALRVLWMSGRVPEEQQRCTRGAVRCQTDGRRRCAWRARPIAFPRKPSSAPVAVRRRRSPLTRARHAADFIVYYYRRRCTRTRTRAHTPVRRFA